MQIAVRVEYSDVTPENVWDHFKKAIVPAIKNWQLDEDTVGKAGSNKVGTLLDQALQKALQSDEDMSEV